MALVSTLTDTFSTSTIDSTKWTVTGTGTSASSVVSGVLTIPTTTQYPNVVSKALYTLTGSSLYAKVTPPAGTTGAEQFYFSMADAADNNDISMYVFGVGQIGFSVKLGGTTLFDQAMPIYPASAPWWRIREASNVLYADTSTDGTTWTNRLSYAYTGTLPVMQAGFVSGNYSSDTPANPGRIDNVNTTGATVITGTLALTIAATSGRSGTARITVPVARTTSAAATLTGSPTARGSMALSASGAVSLQGAPSIAGTLALSATATEALTASPSIVTAVELGGSASSTYTGTPTISGPLALAAETASTYSGAPVITSSASLGASASLTLTGIAAKGELLARAATASAAFTGAPSFQDHLELAALGALDLDGAPTLEDLLGLSAGVSLTLAGAATFPTHPLVPRRDGTRLPNTRGAVSFTPNTRNEVTLP